MHVSTVSKQVSKYLFPSTATRIIYNKWLNKYCIHDYTVDWWTEGPAKALAVLVGGPLYDEYRTQKTTHLPKSHLLREG